MFLDDFRKLLEPLTAPGGECEITEAVVDGQTLRVFKEVPKNLGDMYVDACEQHAEKMFLVYEDEHYTYAEVYASVSALGHQLVNECGIAVGDRVALSMRNYPEWVYSYMAITSIGAVVVPMNAWWTAREMEYGLEDSGALLLIADQQRLECARETALDIPIVVARPEGQLQGAVDMQKLLSVGAGKPMPRPEIAPDDNASIMYTSGTTGFPKGALASHRSIIQAVYTMEFALHAAVSLDPEAAEMVARNPPAVMLTVPLFHVTGAVAIFLSGFPTGRKMIMMYRWDAGEALKCIEREKITAFTGVPTMTWEMLQHPDFDKYNTDSLVTIGGGGAPAPAEQVRQVETKFKGRPGIGYGLTETNAMGATNVGALYTSRPTSTGLPAILIDFAVRDEAGKDLPVNTPGEICVRGPVLVKGYWNKPEPTAESFRDGWFYTGDIGYMDEDGFVYISDRAKDMVIRGGENVYCAEVESAVYDFDGVYECAVFGLPDERLGEIVATVIMPNPGVTIDEAVLRAHLQENIAKFKIPEVMVFTTEQLPRNASGKIVKRDLRDRYSAERTG